MEVHCKGTYEHEPVILAGTSVDLSHEVSDQTELQEGERSVRAWYGERTRYSVFSSHSCGLAMECTDAVEVLASTDVGGAVTRFISDWSVEIKWPMVGSRSRWGKRRLG